MDLEQDVIVTEDHVTKKDLEHAHVTAGQLHSLKKSDEGIILIPQPNEDPNNPLNWTSRKKMTVLLVVSFASM